MPQTILDTIKQSEIILVKDGDQSGIGLLKTLITEFSGSIQNVHVLLYEVCVSDFKRNLKPNASVSLEIHDIGNDLLGWNGNNSLTLETDVVKYLDAKRSLKKKDKSVIIIDSLSSLILHRSAAYTCQVLHKLCYGVNSQDNEVTQVIGLIHKDMHEGNTLSLLEHTASSVLTVTPAISPGFSISCHLLHKKLTGKIIRINEEYKLGQNFEILQTREIKQKKDLEITTQAVDPTANLTFNLTLSDKEKEARRQLQLPYLYDQNRKEDILKKSVGEGKIFYQPDEADDFDEEDPDDDLDI